MDMLGKIQFQGKEYTVTGISVRQVQFSMPIGIEIQKVYAKLEDCHLENDVYIANTVYTEEGEVVTNG